MASNTPTLLLDYSRISRKLAGIYPPLSDAGKISRTEILQFLELDQLFRVKVLQNL